MQRHCLLHSQLSCCRSQVSKAVLQPPKQCLPVKWCLPSYQHTFVRCTNSGKQQRSSSRCCAWRNRKKGQPPVQTPQSDSNATSSASTTDASAGGSQQNNSVPSSGKSPDSAKQEPAQQAHWEDWEDWDSDWEAKPDDEGPRDQFRKNNPRRGMGSKTPRDEYLRPMIDTLGIQYRLGFKQFEAEERVQTEFETNQWESREAVKFGGVCFRSRQQYTQAMSVLFDSCMMSIMPVRQGCASPVSAHAQASCSANCMVSITRSGRHSQRSTVYSHAASAVVDPNGFCLASTTTCTSLEKLYRQDVVWLLHQNMVAAFTDTACVW